MDVFKKERGREHEAKLFVAATSLHRPPFPPSVLLIQKRISSLSTRMNARNKMKKLLELKAPGHHANRLS